VTANPPFNVDMADKARIEDDPGDHHNP